MLDWLHGVRALSCGRGSDPDLPGVGSLRQRRRAL